jgi:sugar/nucleoside kinase (ribokinase family)
VSGRLLCVGDLNADITITTSGEIALGSDTPGRVELSGGGSSANVAAWAVRSGVGARFVGVVGDDVLGDFLVSDLANVGVDVRPVRRAATASRAIAAMVTDVGAGERSMVSDLGTATVMTAGDLDSTWFDETAWLHLTAYTYFPRQGPDVFAWLVEQATGRKSPWSIDPSSSQMLSAGCSLDAVRRAFTGATVIFPNRDEAEWLTGERDPTAAAEQLLDVAETAAVTCGADGAVIARRGHSTFRVAAASTESVNALGCGDAFAAGFIAGRIAGMDDAECARQASSVAAHALALRTAR